jgi:hypothetical protein
MLSATRIATIAVFVVIGAIELFAAVDRQRVGTLSASLSPVSPTSNRDFIVTSAPAGSELRRGDRVRIEDPGDLAALQLQALEAGSTFPLRRIAPPPEAMVADPIVAYGGFRVGPIVVPVHMLFLAMGMLIVARGRASGSLSLAWPIVLLTTLVEPVGPSWPRWIVLAFYVVSPTIIGAALLCATDFATRFASDPQATWARRFRSVGWVIVVAGILFDALASIQACLAPETPRWVSSVSLTFFLGQVVVFLAALVVSFLKAPIAERQRVSWVAASLGTGVAGFAIAVVCAVLNVREPLRDYPLLLTLAIPIGCAYAILRYRLLDIAFVLNRATVFGITSLLVIAALALVDWGLQTLLGSWLLHTGLYVQLALALGIGIATRPLHDRVDAFVDDVFFRQRHETERTLQQFARDVSYIDDSKVVLDRTVETISRAAQLRCAVLLMTGDGLATVAASADAEGPALLDRNDAAVVRLLATREPVDLHQVDTALGGDFAFPMFARGTLIGIVVCSGKTDGPTAYAPDELHAIGTVAHATGLALDLLRIERLERELEAYRAGTPVPRVFRGI